MPAAEIPVDQFGIGASDRANAFRGGVISFGSYAFRLGIASIYGQNGGVQPFGIWLGGCQQHVPCQDLFDDLPFSHHDDLVAHTLYHGHVVRDQYERDAKVSLQFPQHADDLELRRHVERRDGLVGDDYVRLESQSAGDADALTLPPPRVRGESATGTLRLAPRVATDHPPSRRPIEDIVDRCRE